MTPWEIQRWPTRFWPPGASCLQDRLAWGIDAQTAGQVDKRSHVRLTIETRRRAAPTVAGFAWSGWQPSRGPRGSVHVDWVAGFPWIEWQPSHGLGGNLPMDWVADIRGICKLE